MGGLQDRTEHLRACRLFVGVAEVHLDRLAERSTTRRLERGQLLCLEGDRPTSMWLVTSGQLRVFVTSVEGEEPMLTTLSSGAHLGELGVLDDVRRSASVAALRPTTVVEIPAEEVRRVYHADAAVARNLVSLLSARLRETSSNLADLTYLDLGGRLAKYLSRLAAEHGPTFAVDLTQGELAQMLGGARQTVNQLLQALDRAGVIRVQGRTITVVDADKLALRAMSAGPSAP